MVQKDLEGEGGSGSGTRIQAHPPDPAFCTHPLLCHGKEDVKKDVDPRGAGNSFMLTGPGSLKWSSFAFLC